MLPLFAIILSPPGPTATSFKIHPFLEKGGPRRPAWSKKEVWERHPEDRDRRDGDVDAKKTLMTPANCVRSEDIGAKLMLKVNKP